MQEADAGQRIGDAALGDEDKPAFRGYRVLRPGPGKIDGVDTAAAVDRLGAGPGDEGVVAGAAVDDDRPGGNGGAAQIGGRAEIALVKADGEDSRDVYRRAGAGDEIAAGN